MKKNQGKVIYFLSGQFIVLAPKIVQVQKNGNIL